MRVQAFRLENFMAFEDTGWIELKPITLLFGRNSSGKSSIFRALCLLRQSLYPYQDNATLTFYTPQLDQGRFENTVHQTSNNKEELETKRIWVHFRCEMEATLNNARDLYPEEVSKAIRQQYKGNSPIGELSLSFGKDEQETKLIDVVLSLPWLCEGAAFSAEYLFDDRSWWPDSSPLSVDWEQFIGVKQVHGWLPRLNLSSAGDTILTLFDVAFEELGNTIKQFLDQMVHLGPLRPEAQRQYLFTPIQKLEWQQKGLEAFVSLLDSGLDDEQSKRLDNWVEGLDLGIKITIESLMGSLGSHITARKIKIRRKQNSNNGDHKDDDLPDVGSGMSQILPILAQVATARHNTLTMIEQPELHLHPRAQAQLGSIFSQHIEDGIQEKKDEAEKKNREWDKIDPPFPYLIIETHSEHLLLRLRRKIAEKSNFESRHLTLLFADKPNNSNSSALKKIEIDEYGDMLNLPLGYKGFFSSDREEMFAIALAKQKRNEGEL